MASIHFLGAAGTVTSSKFLLEHLRNLEEAGQIPEMDVFVDSPRGRASSSRRRGWPRANGCCTT